MPFSSDDGLHQIKLQKSAYLLLLLIGNWKQM